MTRLNANENPYNPLTQLSSLPEFTINRYPDARYACMTEKIADYLKCDYDEVVLANGSDDLLDALLRSQFNPGDRLLTLEPTFSEYDRLASINGLTRLSPAPTGEGLNTDIGTLMKWILTEQPEGLLLCNPNNPTGQLFTDGEVSQLIAAMPIGAVCIIDEAYKEFAEQCTPFRYDVKGRTIIQVRTLSKAFGFAGLRIGYALISKEARACLSPYLPPYRIGIVNVQLAEQLFSIPRMKREVDALLQEKDRLIKLLSNSSALTVFEGYGNFIWAKAQNFIWLQNKISEQRLQIRTFEGPCEAYVRISIGTPEENNRLLEALREDSYENYAQNV